METKTYRTKELCSIFNEPHTKLKRWVGNFPGEDPVATLRSGHARELTLDDVFQVFLGGLLVADLNFTTEDAKIILNELIPWLHKKRRPFLQAASQEIALNTPTLWVLYIQPTGSRVEEFKFQYLAKQELTRDTSTREVNGQEVQVAPENP